MATVIDPKSSSQRDESQRRVRHPLQRLRSYIRSYVTAEGLAILGLYVALWFWIGLLLDFGFFKVFGVDWVQVAPRGFRAVLLAGLVAGPVTIPSSQGLVPPLPRFFPVALCPACAQPLSAPL